MGRQLRCAWFGLPPIAPKATRIARPYDSSALGKSTYNGGSRLPCIESVVSISTRLIEFLGVAVQEEIARIDYQWHARSEVQRAANDSRSGKVAKEMQIPRSVSECAAPLGRISCELHFQFPSCEAKSRCSCRLAVIGVPVGAPCANLYGLFCPPVVRIACLSSSQVCLDRSERIPPHYSQRHNLHSNLLFLANNHGPLLTGTFTTALRGRILPLGFILVNRHH
jgi:hypothetical protein